MPTGAYTTVVDVWRTEAAADPYYGGGQARLVERAVAAFIDFGAGARRTTQGGTSTQSTFTATTEPADIRSGDVLVDGSSGQRYAVEAAFAVTDPEQSHVQVSLEQITAD